MSKKLSTALCLGLAGFTVSSFGLSTYAVTNDVNLHVNVDPAIALTIQSSSDGAKIYAESDPAGQVVNNYTGEGLTPFGTSSATTKLLPNSKDESMWSKVTVYTNNVAGYKLTVSDTDENTSLVSGSYAIPASATIAAGTSAWGFKGGKFADYTAMSPISSALVVAESTTKSALDGDTTEIHYGVSTSGDQATGTYSDTIVYTVTGEETQPADSTSFFGGITYMQEMTPTICSELTTPAVAASQEDTTGEHAGDTNYVPTKTLLDMRDNKGYKVSKLADGECWMMGNLELDLSTSVALTPETSDVKTTVIPTTNTVSATYSEYGYDGPGYSIPGYNYDDNWESFTFGEDHYYEGEAATAGASTSFDLSIISFTNNYSNSESGYGNLDTSICSKAWQLPTNSGAKSYSGLLDTYGGTEVLPIRPVTGIIDTTYGYRYDYGVNDESWLNQIYVSVYHYASSDSVYQSLNYIQTLDASSYYNHYHSSDGVRSVRCVAR